MLSIFKVKGKSMFPTLKDGELILTRKYLFDRPRPSDIIVLKHPLQPEMKIVKRVESMLDNGDLIVKGDNKESTDSEVFGPIKRESVVGKVLQIKKR